MSVSTSKKIPLRQNVQFCKFFPQVTSFMNACSKEKCAMQMAAFDAANQKYDASITKLYEEWGSKIITDKEFQRKLNTLVNNNEFSKEHLALIQCQVDNCQDELRQRYLMMIGNIVRQMALTPHRSSEEEEYLLLFAKMIQKPRITMDDMINELKIRRRFRTLKS